MKRLRIDRIELDMRGVPRAAARAAARGLGPAIRRELSNTGTAGRGEPHGTGERSLADRAARQIVDAASGSSTGGR